ncbi:MAG: hypothetical protein M3Q71_24755 [Chloroflexota bacterium]|nr:hypothetical protein [Chloroflexota bacterium]
MEGDTVGVAQAPGDQLQVAAVGGTAQDGPVALDIALDHLTRLGLGAEWDVGPRAHRLGQIAQHVPVLVVASREGDVLPRHVVPVGEVLEPLVGEVVGTDDGHVRGRPLAPVQLAVRTDHRVVGVVVAPWEPRHQVLDGAV